MKPDPRTHYLDPVYENSKREAKTILIVFAGFAVYTLCVSYIFGYQQPYQEPQVVHTVLGTPSWAFWGIVIPWFMANIVTAWFCFRFMKDDELEPPLSASVLNQPTEPIESTDLSEDSRHE